MGADNSAAFFASGDEREQRAVVATYRAASNSGGPVRPAAPVIRLQQTIPVSGTGQG